MRRGQSGIRRRPWRIKAETLELLGALPPIVPALDAIISRFGTDAVAEITGRTRRLVTLARRQPAA
jgi:hypothetical protein